MAYQQPLDPQTKSWARADYEASYHSPFETDLYALVKLIDEEDLTVMGTGLPTLEGILLGRGSGTWRSSSSSIVLRP
jgi:hypothetical protein